MVGMVDIAISTKERRFEISEKQAERKSRNESNNIIQSQSDKVEISEEAKNASQNQAVAYSASNTAQILGISDEDLAQLKTERAEGLPLFGEVKLPASQLRVLQYQIQIVGELKGTLHERGDLETELSNLTHAFETVRERVSGDSNRHMNFLEDAFRGVIAGAFFRDAQLSTRTDIWTETPEGRMLNQEALDYNTGLLSEFNNHAKVFSGAFLANFRTQGIQGAFDIAWAAVQQKLSQLNNNQVLSSDEPDNPIEKLLEEYENTGSIGRANKADDTDDTEAQRKLTAMKIARRISNGDNVPMQDHRFLAEYDSNLYKAALKASMVADNDDPETYESLADELAAAENAKALRVDSNSDNESYDSAESSAATMVDSEV